MADVNLLELKFFELIEIKTPISGKQTSTKEKLFHLSLLQFIDEKLATHLKNRPLI